VAIFYGLSLALAFWLSFGPDAGLYALFFHTIPIFSFLRAPARIGIVASLCLVAFAGFALARLLGDGRRMPLLAAALVVVSAAELTHAPLTALREAPPLSSVYRTLAIQPPGVVAEFPYFSRRGDFPRHAFYMLNSTSHFMPLVNGYSDHIPQSFRNDVIPLSSFPSRDSFAVLGSLGARYVVFHLNLYDRRSREYLLERIARYQQYLRPLAKDGDVWLFEIVAFPN
jgi:hypothetical protein